jgi:hypothetical protein
LFRGVDVVTETAQNCKDASYYKPLNFAKHGKASSVENEIVTTLEAFVNCYLVCVICHKDSVIVISNIWCHHTGA